MALYFVDPLLRANAEVVLAAVRQHGMALQYADLHLRADAYVVQEAVHQRAHAWRYADHDALSMDRKTGLVTMKAQPASDRPNDEQLCIHRAETRTCYCLQCFVELAVYTFSLIKPFFTSHL